MRSSINSIRSRPEFLDALDQYAPKVAKRAHVLTKAIIWAIEALQHRLPAEVAFELAADHREVRLLGVLLMAEASDRRSLLVTEGHLDDVQADQVLALLSALESSPSLIDALAWVQPSWFPSRNSDFTTGPVTHSPSSISSNQGKRICAWVHISDLFVTQKIPGEQFRYLQGILQDIREMKSVKKICNFILLSGDIARSGNSADYANAQDYIIQLMRSAEVNFEDVLIVPGNHDIDRQAIGRSGHRLLVALREGFESLDEVLGFSEDRELLAKRMRAFHHFTSRFGGLRNQNNELHAANEIPLWWETKSRLLPGGGIRFIGLNTSILSNDDQDRGKLRVAGLNRLRLNPAHEKRVNEVVIVVSHHPFEHGWLADEAFCNSWLRNRAHAHFHGHAHHMSDVRTVDPIPRVAAGPRTYNYCELIAADDDSIYLRITPREWDEETESFIFVFNQIYWEQKIQFRSVSSVGKNIPQIDMTSMKVLINSALTPSERTRRREAILLLEKYITEVDSGALSAERSQLEKWLSELRMMDVIAT